VHDIIMIVRKTVCTVTNIWSCAPSSCAASGQSEPARHPETFSNHQLDWRSPEKSVGPPHICRSCVRYRTV